MIKKLFLLIFMVIVSFISFSYADDALDQAFDNAKDYQLVTTKINDTHVESWVHKTTKTMLKLAIMIWVAVFLFGGIRFLTSMWDDSKAKKTRDTLLMSALWLVIAFGAWAILQLILSVWATIRT